MGVWNGLAAFSFGGIILALIILLVRLFRSPLHFLAKAAVDIIIAAAILCLLSLLGEYWGYHLPINTATVLVVAWLGMPGVIILAILNFLLVA